METTTNQRNPSNKILNLRELANQKSKNEYFQEEGRDRKQMNWENNRGRSRFNWKNQRDLKFQMPKLMQEYSIWKTGIQKRNTQTVNLHCILPFILYKIVIIEQKKKERISSFRSSGNKKKYCDEWIMASKIRMCCFKKHYVSRNHWFLEIKQVSHFWVLSSTNSFSFRFLIFTPESFVQKYFS